MDVADPMLDIFFEAPPERFATIDRFRKSTLADIQYTYPMDRPASFIHFRTFEVSFRNSGKGVRRALAYHRHHFFTFFTDDNC